MGYTVLPRIAMQKVLRGSAAACYQVTVRPRRICLDTIAWFLVRPGVS